MPARFFIDTEFIESGPKRPIALISLGMVNESGDSLYMVSSQFDPEDASDWVKANVLPHIAGSRRHSLTDIAATVRAFVGEEKPEFWGYYADYDWVVFCQIFGTMMDLPSGWPKYCNDIKQLCMELGNPQLPEQESTEHIAIADACWNLRAYQFLKT